jgi:hypothetical protein
VRNNGLHDVHLLESDNDDDKVLEVVRSHSNKNVFVDVASWKKPVAKSDEKPAAMPAASIPNVKLSKSNVKRLSSVCKEEIKYKKDSDKMTKAEKKKHDQSMKALKYYNKHTTEDKCDEVTGMLIDGDEDWEVGQSQEMHQQILNSRAYEY